MTKSNSKYLIAYYIFIITIQLTYISIIYLNFYYFISIITSYLFLITDLCNELISKNIYWKTSLINFYYSYYNNLIKIYIPPLKYSSNYSSTPQDINPFWFSIYIVTCMFHTYTYAYLIALYTTYICILLYIACFITTIYSISNDIYHERTI